MSNGLPAREGHYKLRLTLEYDDKGREVWTAENPELLGCHVVARDAQEAVDQLAVVREEWIARVAAQGRQVPKPNADFVYTLILPPDHTPPQHTFAERAILTAAKPIRTFFLDSVLLPAG
jgi:predicted RNase H-like HicB family nuclease